MAERLVDVLNRGGNVLHTYPITLGEEANDADYAAKALAAAANGRLVPDDELGDLTARIHSSRGGALAGADDLVAGDSETRLGLEQSVRERAYLLWEQDGTPDGRADDYWHQALDEHLRARAYVLWEQAGRPEGGADHYWGQVTEFQSQ